MKLFSRSSKKADAKTLPIRRAVMREYKERPEAPDEVIVKRVAAVMSALRDFTPVSNLVKDVESDLSGPLGQWDYDLLVDTMVSCGKEAVAERDEAWIALKALRRVKARHEWPELVTFHLAAEQYVENRLYHAEWTDNAYLLFHDPDDPKKEQQRRYLQMADNVQTMLPYERERFIQAADALDEITPQLGQMFAEEMWILTGDEPVSPVG